MKNKCPNFFRFRVQLPLDTYVIDNYFDGERRGGDYVPPKLSVEPDQLLIERNEHFCGCTDLVDNFKTRFQAQDSELFNNKHLN